MNIQIMIYKYKIKIQTPITKFTLLTSKFLYNRRIDKKRLEKKGLIGLDWIIENRDWKLKIEGEEMFIWTV